MAQRRIKRFDVHLVALDPTRGSEIKKTRPCLIVSPDEMNRHIRTVIVAPMTTAARVDCTFQGKSGQIALDQIRTIDKTRLVKRLGRIDKEAARETLKVLRTLFSP